MTKRTKKTTATKTKRTPPANRAALNDPKIREEIAKLNFDAAVTRGLQALVGLTTRVYATRHTEEMEAQEAGVSLIDAYADVLRARDAAPIPLRPTAKAEQARPIDWAAQPAKMHAKRGGSK